MDKKGKCKKKNILEFTQQCVINNSLFKTKSKN